MARRTTRPTAPRGETAGEQVRGAIETMQAILQSAGSSLERIVWVTMLITDPADYDACNDEYIKHFPNGLPARHTAVRFGVPTDAKVAFLFPYRSLAGEDPQPVVEEVAKPPTERQLRGGGGGPGPRRSCLCRSRCDRRSSGTWCPCCVLSAGTTRQRKLGTGISRWRDGGTARLESVKRNRRQS
ncbi:MAG: RidA family protein [Thermomicrobiales bacterium]